MAPYGKVWLRGSQRRRQCCPGAFGVWSCHELRIRRRFVGIDCYVIPVQSDVKWVLKAAGFGQTDSCLKLSLAVCKEPAVAEGCSCVQPQKKSGTPSPPCFPSQGCVVCTSRNEHRTSVSICLFRDAPGVLGWTQKLRRFETQVGSPSRWLAQPPSMPETRQRQTRFSRLLSQGG